MCDKHSCIYLVIERIIINLGCVLMWSWAHYSKTTMLINTQMPAPKAQKNYPRFKSASPKHRYKLKFHSLTLTVNQSYLY